MQPEYDYRWYRHHDINQNLLEECATLFSEHYGQWSNDGPRPGKPIRRKCSDLQELTQSEDSLVATARCENILVAYAIAIQTRVPDCGIMSWVTQLVVHEDYRNQGVAKKLLFSAWEFTDHFAWGLVTANPYAVRALEKATRRKVIPYRIMNHYSVLINVGAEHIPYIEADLESVINDTASCVNTKFFVDHSQVSEMLGKVTSDKNPWVLGEIREGWEWFAFTFRDQEQIPLTPVEIKEMLAVSDRTTQYAYSRMALNENHAWARHQKQEIDFIIRECKIEKNHSVLDFGCGTGRHTFELASRAIETIGVDYVEKHIEFAKSKALEQGKLNCEFIQGDCRSINIEKKFDCVICLYDVIGTFPDNQDNIKIINNIVSHLKVGGYALISVMNFELTENIATNKFSVRNNPEMLLGLLPGSIMEQTGDIFNPASFLLDLDDQIVYRKEQFSLGDNLPSEILVRDRRFRRREIEHLCKIEGLDVIFSRYVQSGKWDVPLEATNTKAKEILILCQKLA